MARLRNKYFSRKTETFENIPTQKESLFDSKDIGSSTSSEDNILRLIPYGSPLRSSEIADTFSDLLYNDSQLNEEVRRVNSLLSDGISKNVEEEFSYIKIKRESISSGNFTGNYLASFGILGGQIKYDQNIYYTHLDTYVKNIIFVNSGTSLILDDITNISVGSSVINDLYSPDTLVASVNIITKTITLDKSPLSTSPQINGKIGFKRTQVFGVPVPQNIFADLKFENIISEPTSGAVYRRDLLEFNTKDSKFYIVRGKELRFLSPINTQLDSMYQIINVNRVSGNEFEVTLKNSIRDYLISSDFTEGDILKIRSCDLVQLNGDWTITEVDSQNKKIKFTIPFATTNLFEIDPNLLDSKVVGLVDIGRISVYSIPLIKSQEIISEGYDVLIIDNIQRVSAFSGLSTSLTSIRRALLQQDDDGMFSVKNRDLVHLTDELGRPLDWEHGQSFREEPVVGFTSYGENISLTKWIDSAVPMSYESIDKSLGEDVFSNVPFWIDYINDDVFSSSQVTLSQFNIAIKNDPNKIGKESLDYKILKPVSVFDTPRSCGVSANSFNLINDPLQGDVEVDDFVLITGGRGKGQISKVIEIDSIGRLVINTLKISINNTSSYIAFKNISVETPEEITSGTISSSEILSQVVTGINGYFGENGDYRKIKITLENNILINLANYYFISLKQRNANNDAWDLPPQILISSFDSQESYQSAFLEVFYKTIKGIYGTSSSSVVLEDDFGNLDTEVLDRTRQPHFKPIRYQVISRGLDESVLEGSEPLSDNIVHFDVHSGKVRFKTGSQPLNLYISYFRKNSANGDLSDFSVIHKEKNDFKQITVQDKFTEIDARFEKGTSFLAPVKTNGILSPVTSNGFKGPFIVDTFDSFHMKYSLPDLFENGGINSKDFMVKFSNHYYDQISRVEKNSIYVTNDVFLIEDIIQEDTDENSPDINFVDYIDTSDQEILSSFYSTGVYHNDASNINTLGFPGMNKYDEIIVPGKEKIFSGSSFLKKRWNGGFKEDISFFADEAFYDITSGVSLDGRWNEQYTQSFGDFQFLRSLLGKVYFEDQKEESSKYPTTQTNKRRFKQRESIGVFTDQMLRTGVKRSIGKVIDEPLFSFSKTLDSKTFNENFVYATAENQKDSFSLESGTAATFINETISDNKYDTLISSNFIYTVYTKQISTNYSIFLDKKELIKNDNELEENSFSSIGNEWNESFEENETLKIKVRILDFDINSIGILYADINGDIFFELHSKEDGSLIEGSKIKINESTSTMETSNASLIDCITVGNNLVSVIWVSSQDKIFMNMYQYDYESASSMITEENTILQFSSNIQPKLSKFSRGGGFIAAYKDNSNDLKIKKFSSLGKIEQIEVSGVNYVDLTVTDSSVDFSVKELNDNNLLFCYKKSNGDFAFTKLDDYYLSFSEENIFYNNTSSSNFKLIDINENTFLFVDKDTTNQTLTSKLFFNNLIEIDELQISSWDGDIPIYSSINFNSLLGVYYSQNQLKRNNFDLKLKFDDYFIQNPSVAVNSSIASGSEIFRSINFSSNEEGIIFSPQQNTFKMSIINRDQVSGYTKTSNYDLVSGTQIQSLDSFYLKNEDGVELALFTYVSSSSVNLKMYKKQSNVGNDSWVLYEQPLSIGVIGSNLHLKTISKVKITYLGSNIILLSTLLSNKDLYFNIIRLDDFFNNNTSTFNTTNSSLLNAQTKYISSIEGNIKIIPLQNYEGFYTTIGIFYEKSGNEITFKTIDIKLNDDNDLSDDEKCLITSPTFSAVSILAGSKISIDSSASFKNKKIILTYLSSATQININEYSFQPDTVLHEISLNKELQAETGTSISNLFSFYCKNETDVEIFYIDNGTIKWKTVYSNEDSDKTESLSISSSEIYVNKLPDSYSVFFKNSSNGISVVNVETWFLANDINSKRTYKINDKFQSKIYSTIKIGGIDFRGEANKKIIIDSYDTQDLEEHQINEYGIFESKNHLVDISVLNLFENQFTVVIHDSFGKLENNFIKIRHFVFERKRIFARSPWYTFRVSDLIESSDPEDATSIDLKRIFLKAIETTDKSIFITWSDSFAVKYSKMLLGPDGSMQSTTVLTYSEDSKSFEILSIGSIVEGNTAILLYDDSTETYRTLLFDKNINLITNNPKQFTISSLDRNRDIIGNIKISPFGYFYHMYIKRGQNKLKLFQHGWNGTKFGSIEIVGKNYLEAIQTTPSSFAEKISTTGIISEIPTTHRVEYEIPDDDFVLMSDSAFFPSYLAVVDGVIDIWIKDNPLVSGRAFVKFSPTTLTFISNHISFVNATGDNINTDVEDGKLTLFQRSDDSLFLVNRTGSTKNIIFIRNI